LSDASDFVKTNLGAVIDCCTLSLDELVQPGIPAASVSLTSAIVSEAVPGRFNNLKATKL